MIAFIVIICALCLRCVDGKTYNITTDYYTKIHLENYIEQTTEPDIIKNELIYKLLIFFFVPLITVIVTIITFCAVYCVKTLKIFADKCFGNDISDRSSNYCPAVTIYIFCIFGLFLIGGLPLQQSDIPDIILIQQNYNKLNNLTHPYIEYMDYKNPVKTITQYCEEYIGINDNCNIIKFGNITPTTIECNNGPTCCNSTIICNPVCESICVKGVNNSRAIMDIRILSKINFTYTLYYPEDTIYVTKILTCNNNNCENEKNRYDIEYIKSKDIYYQPWNVNYIIDASTIYLSGLQIAHIIWWFITYIPILLVWLVIIVILSYYFCKICKYFSTKLIFVVERIINIFPTIKSESTKDKSADDFFEMNI